MFTHIRILQNVHAVYVQQYMCSYAACACVTFLLYVHEGTEISYLCAFFQWQQVFGMICDRELHEEVFYVEHIPVCSQKLLWVLIKVKYWIVINRQSELEMQVGQ